MIRSALASLALNKEKEGIDMHKLIVPYAVDLTIEYEAGAVAFFCIDARVQPLSEELVEYLKQEGKYDYVDPVTVAGGAKGLSAPAVFLVEQIRASVRLHHTPTIVLTTHEDCGAYGHLAKRGSRTDQFLFHLEQHCEIERAVLFRFPKFKGKTRHFYLSAKGAIELDLSAEKLSEEEARTLSLT